MMLTASMQIDLAAFDPASQKDDIDVMGVALDDRGAIFSFKQKVNINPEVMTKAGLNSIRWKQDLLVRPGLYQVRVAVRDRQTGRLGSAMQWIEIPKG